MPSRSTNRPTLIVAGSSFLAAAVAFLINILMARALGPSSRGSVAFLLQLAYFVAPVSLMGLERSILKNGSRGSPFMTGGYVLGINTAIGAALSLLYGLEAWLVIGVSLSGCFLSILRAEALHHGNTRRFALSFSVQQGSALVVSLSLYALSVDVWQMWAAAYCLTGLLMILSEMRSIAVRDKCNINRDSISLMPGSLAALVVARADRIILGVVAAPAQLGLYVTVATATEPIFWVAQAMADRRSNSSRSETRTGVRDFVLFGVASTLIASIMAFLIVPLFGPAYGPARAYLLPLAVASPLLAMYRQNIAALLRSSSSRIVSSTEGVTALVALPTYYVLIQREGALGAAWASAIVYLFGFSLARGVRLRAAKIPDNQA